MDKKEKFSFKLFFFPSLFLILLYYLNHGIIDSWYCVFSSLVLPYFPSNMAKYIALNNLPRNLLPLYLMAEGNSSGPNTQDAEATNVVITASVNPSSSSGVEALETAEGIIKKYDMSYWARGKSGLYNGRGTPPASYNRLYRESWDKTQRLNSAAFLYYFNNMRAAWCEQALVSANNALSKYQTDLAGAKGLLTCERNFIFFINM